MLFAGEADGDFDVLAEGGEKFHAEGGVREHVGEVNSPLRERNRSAKREA